MSPNITINGLPPSPTLIHQILSNTDITSTGVIEEHEPFSHKLFSKAKENARQEEDLIEEIAALRRKVPGVVTERNKKRFKEETEADDEALRVIGERMKEERKVGSNVLGIERLERHEGVEANWEAGIKGLEGAMKTMPEMVARSERARKAEEYVNGMHGK